MIHQVIGLTGKDIDIFNKYVETRQYGKKEQVLQEGRICNHLYYVEKGCLRMYFLNKKGVEQITQFALDGWWISDYQSFINNAPSAYSIQTIEESRIVSIDNENFDRLLNDLPQLEKYFRMIILKAVAGAQLRSKLLYEMSKEEFYQHFSSSFPEFMRRVPQYMIASYLGLTPEYLSELRKKKL
jgi:CRP/FNR family transcriptional regulator, anaerobic regulatory protein